MPSHEIEWREVTVAEYNQWMSVGYEEGKPFPLATWVTAVDGVPLAEVDTKTRLAILPEVHHFLAGLRATWLRLFDLRMKGAGANSSASVEAMTSGSTKT